MSTLLKEKTSKSASILLMGELMDKAEKKVRTNEPKAEKKLNEELKQVNEAVRKLEEEAEKMGLGVQMGLGVHKKRQRSNIKHVQLIQENLSWAFENNLLTETEQHFLFRISPLVEFGSNAICKKVNGKLSPCNITELSKLVGKTRPNTSILVNKLVQKGFLGVFETGVDGVNPNNENEPNPAKAKMMFINPRIMHSGYNDNVNETLQRMFKNSLKKAPIKMF